MSTVFVALLRGVNVGGNQALPSAVLKSACENAGFEAVKTYLQSGNVVFRAKERSEERVASQVREALQRDARLDVAVLLRSAAEMRKIEARNPFDGREGNRVHVLFLSATAPASAKKVLQGLTAEGEELLFEGTEVFVHLPNGAGRSKLAAAFTPKKIGVDCTARNWNTVTALAKLARELDAQR